MRRRSVRPLLLLALVLLAAPGCGETEDRQRGLRTAPADRFVDSFGVNVHMSYNDTAYANRPAVRAALRELGVRHIRDGIVLGREDQFAALRTLARDGIRSNLILGDPQGRFGTGTLDAQLATLRSRLRAAAETVEGPNEYDSSGDPALRRSLGGYQQRLYRSLKRDPALAGLPVVGPSLIDGSRWPVVGNLSRWLDFGNIHPYPGGEPPAAADIEGQLDLVRPGSRSDPVFATETGYHNALAAPPTQQPGVSERAAAVYLPRLLLEHFRLGIPRTFLYELVDERPEPAGLDAEQHFGLLRNDFSRKPAFGALRNLVDLLEDPGPSFEPEGLDLSIKSGAPVRDLRLQKRNGRFYLALWRPVGAWSKDAKVDIVPPPVAVDVRLKRPFKRVRLFSPVRSARAVRSWKGSEPIRLQLGAEPLVLEIEED